MSAAEIVGNIVKNVGRVIVGKDQQIRDLLCCWISGGHALIEDVPGTGKTILARAIAKSVNVPFSRVQFTPDLLPSDITGASIYRQAEGRFEFMKGPLFTSILLGDEINRATPRTQSALLEAMSEGQVSVDGTTLQLDPLFFTIATQNPIDQLGTFELPEAQLDRFMMKISMGFPQRDEEIALIKNQNRAHPIQSLERIESAERLAWVRAQVPEVGISPEVYDYVMNLIEATRNSMELRLGASPRATVALIKSAQAMALIEGQRFVSPQHIFELAGKVLAHRLLLTTDAKMAGRTSLAILADLLKGQSVPMRKI